MEFPEITVGGGIQGGAGESSSFKYGFFHNICSEYEMVLGNGKIITASPTKNADLFYDTACSYGSLGIITLIKLHLIPAKNFVHLTYNAVKDPEEAVSLIEKKVGETATIDFVDGIIFAKNRGVVMTGKFADKNNLPASTFNKRADEWFYLHADKISKRCKKYEEIIPIKDYLFRYDQGGFWVGRYAFSFFKMPFTKLTRYILHKYFKTRTMYRAIQATNITQQYFVQDLCLPKKNFLKFLQFVDAKLHIYPLWLCPGRPDKHEKFSPGCIETNLIINTGVWGNYTNSNSHFFEINRDVENKVMALQSRKVLYAHAYYPRNEFWKIYDHAWYNSLRKKYFADSVFLDIYDKIKVSEKYKPSALDSGTC